MASALQQEIGCHVELVKGSGGIFDVEVDGRLIYSKKQTGRFPEFEDIKRAIGATGR